MEIRTEQEGKWISPMYGKFLTQSSATKDEDRVVAKQVYIPLDESNDEWTEISKEDAERIFKTKKAARGQVEYPEEQVNQMISLFASQINNMNISDNESLQFRCLYPQWKEFIGEKLPANFKVNYNNNLYKTKQEIAVVLDQDGYRPGEQGSEALYEEINESNAGTEGDPIPYNNNMELFEGKYYSQNGITYKCTRNTEQAVYQDLSGLVGIYVEVAN